MFKDLPEGQTHYENDNCGEPAHNRAMPKDFIEEAVENFCNHISDWSYFSAHEELDKILLAHRQSVIEECLVAEPEETRHISDDDLFSRWRADIEALKSTK